VARNADILSAPAIDARLRRLLDCRIGSQLEDGHQTRGTALPALLQTGHCAVPAPRHSGRHHEKLAPRSPPLPRLRPAVLRAGVRQADGLKQWRTHECVPCRNSSTGSAGGLAAGVLLPLGQRTGGKTAGATSQGVCLTLESSAEMQILLTPKKARQTIDLVVCLARFRSSLERQARAHLHAAGLRAIGETTIARSDTEGRRGVGKHALRFGKHL